MHYSLSWNSEYHFLQEHSISQAVKGSQQQITLTCSLCAGQNTDALLTSQNLNDTQVSTSLGARDEFISRKHVADVVWAAIHCVLYQEGIMGDVRWQPC